jgi:uncharacterized membrane protein YdjX (TVP38/TMEM64 family)
MAESRSENSEQKSSTDPAITSRLPTDTRITTTPGPDAAEMRGGWWGRLLVCALLATALAGGWWLYAEGEFSPERLEERRGQLEENLLTAVLIYFVVYVAVTALQLPFATLMTLAGGVLFGRWLGTVVVSFASTAGATLAFLLSRYLLRDFVQRRFGRGLEPINRGVERDGAYYLLTLRLVPAFPFFVVNALMGLTPMRVGTYWWVSQLGMLPATFLYVNAGAELGQIKKPEDVLSPTVIVSLVLLGIVPLALRKIVQACQRPREQ